MKRKYFLLGLALLFTLAANSQETPAPPENFIKFEFEGQEDAAKVLTDYAWYHFYNRGGNGPTLFNKEYLTVADMWMGGAIPRGESRSIQEVHRADLLAIQLDDEGYVNTHQHFSYANDWGWPFPLWTQAGRGREEVLGKTVGWQFQNKDALQGWTADYLKAWGPEFYGDAAVASWSAEDLTSQGIVENRWHVTKTGPKPALISPEGVVIEAEQAPFIQIRWTCNPAPPKDAVGYLEWMGRGETSFNPKHRMYFYPETTHLSNGLYHSILPMHELKNWQGKIIRMRFVLPGAETAETYDIESIFTAYDTRHTINNPIFVLASCWYFNWTGDLAFLRENIGRMRKAMKYMQVELGGVAYNHIRNQWPGHDGLPGFVRDKDGKQIMQGGHGIGNNYWDLMPFGWDDFYSTSQYYGAMHKLEDLELLTTLHPEWDIPGRSVFAPEPLPISYSDIDGERFGNLSDVQEEANKKFWNEKTGRFYASIDKNGTAYDYGYTFLNLEAIWYGIASPDHAKSIMSWINGDRIVEGDTSTGADIYHWRFGPRATTKRNVDWYGQGWTAPESIPWGGQVQDGGAVLGFTFYDLWARLQVLGADNAWTRLQEIVAWEKEVKAADGYRAYYADGKQGTSLQGGGTAGGLGIDHEFYESSLLPSIIPYGFMGISPRADLLVITPQLPAACPKMILRNLQYQKAILDIEARNKEVIVTVREAGHDGVKIFSGTQEKTLHKGDVETFTQ